MKGGIEKVLMLTIEKHLKDHDVKPSYQRIKIFEYLIKHKNHPTVDTIYHDLVHEIPTLSKTTVYNTLNLFLDKKIVQLIGIEETEARYDADISAHGHFKCLSCGKIYDIYTDMMESTIKQLEGFQVFEKQLYFKGVCKRCQEK